MNKGCLILMRACVILEGLVYLCHEVITLPVPCHLTLFSVQDMCYLE